MCCLEVLGSETIWLEGRQGRRYWIRHPFEITGRKEVDETLSSYPLAVFQPSGRNPESTPIVIGLQGMAAPYQWNGFIVSTLLDMGISCVLFDTPFAGERSHIRDYPGDVIRQVIPLAERRIKFETLMVLTMMNAVARDMKAILRLLRERHGLCDHRIALFGVSLGCLMSAYAFTRDGIGQRLLGILGHADLQLFARSYTPFLTPLIVSLPGRMASRLLGFFLGRFPEAALAFLTTLNDLCSGSDLCVQANPMTYVSRVDDRRRVRFLVGQDDSLVRPADADSCSLRFRDGNCYVVPGMRHGGGIYGPSFVEHVRNFLGTQLGDWQR